MKTPRHSNFLGCDNARFGGDRDHIRPCASIRYQLQHLETWLGPIFEAVSRYLNDCLGLLKSDLLMVSDVKGQHFRFSGENVSRFQADTRLCGYARRDILSVTVNEGRSHRSNHITPTPFSRSPMIGSANARWKVTVSIRIFEVLQVLTSRRAIDEDAGSAIAIR